jgi:RHS repeat-associated protein
VDYTGDSDSQSDINLAFGHQGLYHDTATGLVYNRARMLNPTLGRFNQRDPLGYVDGMSVYAGYHLMYGGLDPFGTKRYTVDLTFIRSRTIRRNGMEWPENPEPGDRPEGMTTIENTEVWTTTATVSFDMSLKCNGTSVEYDDPSNETSNVEGWDNPYFTIPLGYGSVGVGSSWEVTVDGSHTTSDIECECKKGNKGVVDLEFKLRRASHAGIHPPAGPQPSGSVHSTVVETVEKPAFETVRCCP